LLLCGIVDVEAAVGRGADAMRARAAADARSAAKSQQVLHERIRSGVAVGRGSGAVAAPKPLTGKQAARAAKAAAKADRRQRLQEQNEAWQAG
jgi:hypothetical protein